MSTVVDLIPLTFKAWYDEACGAVVAHNKDECRKLLVRGTSFFKCDVVHRLTADQKGKLDGMLENIEGVLMEEAG